MTSVTDPSTGLTCDVAARNVRAGYAVWVNGRWRAVLSGAEETVSGLVTIALSGVGLVHLPARRLLTVTTL